MSEALYQEFLRPGEVAVMGPDQGIDSPEARFGYSWAEIQNSTHEGNSVIFDIARWGTSEPMVLDARMKLKITTLSGSGMVVIHNTHSDDPEDIRLVPLYPDPDAEPVEITDGDAYYYMNTGLVPLRLRDDATPAFQDGDELPLMRGLAEGRIDARHLQLPANFLPQLVYRDYIKLRNKKNPKHPEIFSDYHSQQMKVGPKEYWVVSGDAEKAEIIKSGVLVTSESSGTQENLFPGVSIRGAYIGDGKQNPKPIVQFRYYKEIEPGVLEPEDRLVIYEGLGFGQHPFHGNQPAAYYLIGKKVGTVDAETGRPKLDVTEGKIVTPNNYSFRCIEGGPYGKPILANVK